MNKKIKLSAYGTLCSLFYDATKKFAPEKEIDFYAGFLKNNGRILEAMCGSGRVLIPLIQRGYTVDGVDNSSVMLERCRQRCSTLNISADLYEQSLEQLNVPHKYAAVTIAVGSFQLITDRTLALKSLQNLRAHMLDNADLLLDIFEPEINEEPSIRTAKIDSNTEIRLTIRYIFYPEEKKSDAFCLYELFVKGICKQQEQELIQITWYSDTELKELLEKAGFEIVAFHEAALRSGGPSRIVHARAIS